MHMQPLYSMKAEFFSINKKSVSEYLFENGVCLPSGCNLKEEDQSLISLGNKKLFKKMKIYNSKIRKNKILHIVFKKNDFKEMNKESRKDLISPDQFIQLSALKLKDQSFKPHFIFGRMVKKDQLPKNRGLLLMVLLNASFMI